MPLSIQSIKALGVAVSKIEEKAAIIKEVKGREVLDSRGNPTVEVRRPRRARPGGRPLDAALLPTRRSR